MKSGKNIREEVLKQMLEDNDPILQVEVKQLDPYSHATLTLTRQNGDLVCESLGYAKKNPVDTWDAQFGRKIVVGRAIRQMAHTLTNQYEGRS